MAGGGFGFSGGGSSITLPVSVANGGTGLSSYTVGDLIYASGATTLSKLADVATGSVLVSGGVGVAPSWTSSLTLGTMVSAPSGAFTSANSLVVGQASTATGKILFRNAGAVGSTSIISGTVAGNIIFTLPTTVGSASQFLQTDGAGVLSWATPSSGITVGTTTITGGATGLILYQKSDGTVQASELKYVAPASTYDSAKITVGSGGNHVIKFINGGGTTLMDLEEGVALGVGAGVYTSFSTYKIAIGQSATANQGQSIAIGALSSATHTNSMALGYAATTTATNQLVFGAAAAAGGLGVYDNVYFNGVTFTSAASVNLRACGGSGSNNVAANLNLYAGLSTGSGTPATIGLYSSAAGASSSTAQTAVKVLEITNSTTITTSDAVNYALGSTTGTKFGTANTQKLAFWNATPIVQPSGATQAAPAAYATGAFGLDSDANMQALYDLVVAMRTALVNVGIMKGSA